MHEHSQPSISSLLRRATERPTGTPTGMQMGTQRRQYKSTLLPHISTTDLETTTFQPNDHIRYTPGRARHWISKQSEAQLQHIERYTEVDSKDDCLDGPQNVSIGHHLSSLRAFCEHILREFFLFFTRAQHESRLFPDRIPLWMELVS